MPTLAETLDATEAKLQKLAGSPPTTVHKAEDVLNQIAAELKAGKPSKERSEYLAGVLDELRKNNWEATTFARIREINDPMQLKPSTEPAPTIQALTTGTPDGSFSTNVSTALKAQMLQKMIEDPSQLRALNKGEFVDKLDDIMAMFGLTEADLLDEYDMRWKVGSLVTALYNAAKLETLVGKADKPAGDAPAAPQPAVEPRWPSDMASAKFDPVKKAYELPPSPWGPDSKA